MKTALICGVSGQDGAYLATQLLDRGYRVAGTSRETDLHNFGNLARLGILDRVELLSMSGTDFRSVLTAVAKIGPDEIYNLAGQSSVGRSFEQPVETLESIGLGTLNLLEAIRFLDVRIRLYNAGSSECFGNTGSAAADETTPFRPRSPYAVAKATAFWEVASYRDAYGLFACSGILFNHESPLRPDRFVTQKVVKAAVRIAAGGGERLPLGDLSIERDWGWAPDYVDGMWRMLQQEVPRDFVLATGVSTSLQSFVEQAFAQVGLDWRDHVDADPSLRRPSEIQLSRGNPTLARKEIGWQARFALPDVIRSMIESARGEVADGLAHLRASSSTPGRGAG